MIVGSLTFTSTFVHAGETGVFDRNRKSVEIAWDVLIVRPASYIAMAAAAIIYVPAALITLGGRNDIEPVQDALLKEPYYYAVKRPLGQFD